MSCCKHPAFSALQPSLSQTHAPESWPDHAALDALLEGVGGARSEGGASVHFVPQPPRAKRGSERAREAIYDAQIYLHGAVYTRSTDWHDLMNALVWCAFPRAKSMINARQYRALCERVPERFRALPSARTAEQDALAMLDEGSLIVLAAGRDREAVQRAADEGDEAALEAFVTERRARCVLFGHALYEHLIVRAPTPVRAMCNVFAYEDSLDGALAPLVRAADRALAEGLADGSVPRASSRPLGVLLRPELFVA